MCDFAGVLWHASSCATWFGPRTHGHGEHTGEQPSSQQPGSAREQDAERAQVRDGCSCSHAVRVFAPEEHVRFGSALVTAGFTAVSYEYATRAWLQELRESFGSRERAAQQCALDWPRMCVRDDRSWAAAYLWRASDLQVFFANQAALAKPFGALMAAYPGMLVTQCSAAPVSLLLRADGTVLLEKAAVVWQPRDGHDPAPLLRVHVAVDVGPRVASVVYRPARFGARKRRGT